MARCASWRYHVIPGHKEHVPGDCRACWTPCREKVDERGERCRDCLRAIISSPDQRVREALLGEAELDDETLEMLVSDPHPLIVMRAQEMLAERQSAAAPQPVPTEMPENPVEGDPDDIDLDQMSARTAHPRPRTRADAVHPSDLIDRE